MPFSSISQIHVKINLVFLCSKDLWGGWPSGSQLLCYSTVHRVQCNGTRVSWCNGLSSCVSCPKGSVKNVYRDITISAVCCAAFCIWNCSDPFLQIHSCWTWLFTLFHFLFLVPFTNLPCFLLVLLLSNQKYQSSRQELIGSEGALGAADPDNWLSLSLCRHFSEFLRSHHFCKYQIEVLTSGTVYLADILFCESALFYFSEVSVNIWVCS